MLTSPMSFVVVKYIHKWTVFLSFESPLSITVMAESSEVRLVRYSVPVFSTQKLTHMDIRLKSGADMCLFLHKYKERRSIFMLKIRDKP